MSVTGLSLDDFDQAPAFREVQVGLRRKWPEQWKTIEHELRLTALELGEFTADDVMDRVGRPSVPMNLIGALLGSYSARGFIRVVGRQKARHPEAKGRFVNRFTFVNLTLLGENA